MFRKICTRLLILCSLVAALYGAGRLYFHLTAGFSLENIESDFAYNSDWDVRQITHSEQVALTRALDQPYHYLGKGCQSYVFMSQDQQYVIKFFKYQRYRLLPWLAYFPPLPAIVQYRKEKIEKKRQKLDGFMKSWKIAFDHLKEETGLVFVHLNKTSDLHKQLIIFDKIGKPHTLDLDQMEFCIQHRADMLCDTLLKYKANEDLARAQNTINELLNLILSEYDRGLADNDHALMQNTGVAEGRPIHIDVGQFVLNEQVKNPEIFHVELFTKTYKFKLWLREYYPELADYLEERLQEIIGLPYATMRPKFREKH